MEYITEENLIILWAFGFAAHMAYTFGRRVGIEDAIDYLAEKGIIELDDDWKNISWQDGWKLI